MYLVAILYNILTLIFILSFTIYIYFKYIYTYWKRHNIPYLEPTFPFGNMKSLLLQKQNLGDSFQTIYNDLKTKSKLCGGFYFCSKPNLMILDPELIKTIFTKDFKYFKDQALYYDEESDPLSVQLVALKGLRWKNLRAKFTPAFSTGKLKTMIGTLVQCSDELNEVIDDHISRKEPLDIHDIFARLTTDTIGSCAFGLNCNSLKYPQNEFREYSKRVFNFTTRDLIVNIFATNWPEVLRFFKIPVIQPDVSKFYINILKQTIEYREKNNISRKDFLDTMIRIKNNQSIWNGVQNESTDATITFNELAAQSFSFFVAGFETLTAALSFCLFELCENQEIQNKVRDEVNTVLEKYNWELNYEAVMELKYMDKVFDEVFRKYPPFPMLGRECTEDYTIPNTTMKIKKGTEIVVSTFGIQRDPDYFPNPDRFDPERFSEEQKSTRHPSTYLPFGDGPRICIGFRFSLIQVKIVLATLVKNYKFTLDSTTKTPIEFNPINLILNPANPIWIIPEKLD